MTPAGKTLSSAACGPSAPIVTVKDTSFPSATASFFSTLRITVDPEAVEASTSSKTQILHNRRRLDIRSVFSTLADGADLQADFLEVRLCAIANG